jgi:hypothetical protein
MVTYQSFQKVFKLRYDEGRAHVRLTDFADSSIAQPYTTEQRIKYDRMLGKTRVKHFNTNFNTHSTLPIFNDIAGLSNSLNYYFFEFPFFCWCHKWSNSSCLIWRLHKICSKRSRWFFSF